MPSGQGGYLPNSGMRNGRSMRNPLEDIWALILLFTKKEERMMHDPYFEVIRETDNFVEVQSVCTGHYWNVFKNTFEAGNKITLYHKHNRKDKWYHEHRSCRTVSDAVDQIR